MKIDPSIGVSVDILAQELHKISKYHKSNFIEIIDILKAFPDILGVLLGGSLSRGNYDNYSDIDLFCLCDQGKSSTAKNALINEFQKLKNIEKIIEQESFGWMGETITIYFSNDPYFSIDIGLVNFSESDNFFWEPTGIILWDYKGIILRGKNTSIQLVKYKKYPFASQFPVRHSVILLKKTKKNLLRNHLWNCIEYTNKLRRNLLFIIRIHVVKKNDFLGNPERDIEDVLPQDILERLNRTQPGINRGEIAETVFLLTDWLVEVVNTGIIEYETKEKADIDWLQKELLESREWFYNFIQTFG